MIEHERTAEMTRGKVSWRMRIALRILQRIHVGRLEVILPDGSRQIIDGLESGPQATIEFRSDAVINRLIRGGDIGFAESYMAGEWEAPDLGRLLYLLHLNEDALIPKVPGLSLAGRFWHKFKHAMRRNSRRGSRRNIAYHYDLGNDFYSLWLDETWAYSAAVFEGPDQELAAAQENKFRLLLERLDLHADDHLLEIGCGWGGFAIYAAEQTGCHVTGITLSREQLAVAREKAVAAGLTDRVTFRLQDYRDIREQFDRVVSIEMYEAVGEAYWPTYFATIRKVLKSGGRAVIQGITIDDASFDYYRENVDFIQKYIFPGGMLASPEGFMRVAQAQGLKPIAPSFYGRDYAETLRRWHHLVLSARREIVQRFDARFLRMWRYYLAYCEAGFESGNIDLMHITLEKP